MLNIFKKTYFIFLMVAGLTMLFVNANAKEGSPEDVAYHRCASEAFYKFKSKIAMNPQKFERDVCKFLDTEIGQQCENKLQVLTELGFLQNEMSRFVVKTAIEPACGKHL